jgi:hypothetical protein
MADSQGDPVGGPVPWVRGDLRCGSANVEDHSANPVEVQTNDDGALVKRLVPGMAQPFNRLLVAYRFGGRWWVGRKGSAQGQGHRYSGGLEVCLESAQWVASSTNEGRIGGLARTIGLKMWADQSLWSVGHCRQVDFKTR